MVKDRTNVAARGYPCVIYKNLDANHDVALLPISPVYIMMVNMCEYEWPPCVYSKMSCTQSYLGRGESQ